MSQQQNKRIKPNQQPNTDTSTDMDMSSSTNAHQSPLLDSGVLSVLLHHPAFTEHYSILCRLLCVSAGLSSAISAHCRRAVTLRVRLLGGRPSLAFLKASSSKPSKQGWVARHAELLRALCVDYSLLSASEADAADAAVYKLLQKSSGEQQLAMSSFEIQTPHVVDVGLLQLLPVSTLTRLVFQDRPDKRQQEHMHAKAAALDQPRHIGPGYGNMGLSKAQKKELLSGSLLGLAQACRRLSNLRELEVTTLSGHADFLLPQVAFLKHLTLLVLDKVSNPNKSLSTHLPKGLRELTLTYTVGDSSSSSSDSSSGGGSSKTMPLLDLSKCKMLSRLVCLKYPMAAKDLLPVSLTHLHVGSCTSLDPLRPLKHLKSLVISGAGPQLAFPAAAADWVVQPLAPCEDLVELKGLTELRLSGKLLPPEARLPTRLKVLALTGLPDSVAQLTGLQCLAELHIEHLGVSPEALAALTTLTQLSHLDLGLTTSLMDVPSLRGGARKLTAYLELMAAWGLPLKKLQVMAGVLTPRSLQLIGRLRCLTELRLMSCKAQVDGVSYDQDKVFKLLCDPIRSWTQLQSLAFDGASWDIELGDPSCVELVTRALQQLVQSGKLGARTLTDALQVESIQDMFTHMHEADDVTDVVAFARRGLAAALRDRLNVAAGAGADTSADTVAAVFSVYAPEAVGDAARTAAIQSELAAAILAGALAAAGVDVGADAGAGAVREAAAAGPGVGTASRNTAAGPAAAEAGAAAAGAGGVPAAAAAAVGDVAIQLAVLLHDSALAARAAFQQASSEDRRLKWGFMTRPLGAALGSLTQLSQLSCSGWHMRDSVTRLRHLTRLQSLDLTATQQSDATLCGLLPALGLLTHLSLSRNSLISFTPLASLDLLQPQLRVLDVRRCPGVLESPFKRMMQQHPELQVLVDTSSRQSSSQS